MTGFDKRSVAPVNAEALVHGNPEISMQEMTEDPASQTSPDELDMLQRTFDRVYLVQHSPLRKARRTVGGLITGHFHDGIRDESALFENAMWLEHTNAV